MHTATDTAHLREWTSKLAVGKVEIQPRLHITTKGSRAPAKSRSACVGGGGEETAGRKMQDDRSCSRRESGVGGRKGEREEIMKTAKEIKGLESVM